MVVCFMWRNCVRSELSRTLIAQGRRQSTTYTKITDSLRPNFVIASFASSSLISISYTMVSLFALKFASCFSASSSRFVHFLICPFSFFSRWSCQVLVSMCLVPLTKTDRKKRKQYFLTFSCRAFSSWMIAACPKSCVVDRTFFEPESPELPNVAEGLPELKVDRLPTGGGCRGKEL